ncbi:MAG TPA: hypothetical protein VGW38_26260 [Chloroflexota bacterium]|nr:hypothetical protein [Chloroflexota bacterium]
MTKRILLVPAGALAIILAAASLAYACTIVGGQTEITSIGGQTTQCKTDDPNLTFDNTQCKADVSSPAGRAITAKAAGAKAGQTYYLHFLNKLSDQDGMKICMSGLFASHPDIQIGGPATADDNGNIPEVSASLPSNVHPGSLLSNHLPHNGVASVCHITSNANYGTQDATILITGGSK